MRMPPKNFFHEVETWRTAGFEPDADSLAEYVKWYTPKVTMRPTLAALAVLLVILVGARFFPGRAIIAGLLFGATGIITVWLLQRHEWVARRDGEDRLRAEYEL